MSFVLYPPFLSSPFLPGGKRQPSWPIAFKCETQKDAEAIAHVHTLINEHIGFNLDLKPAQQAHLIWRCEAIKRYSASPNLQGPYYGVVYTGNGGSESMIYRDWHKDVSPVINGSMKPIFRRLELLHEAVVFMILRGEKSLLQDYIFMSKEPSQQATPRSNSRHQLAVSPPSTPSRKFKSESPFQLIASPSATFSRRVEGSPSPNIGHANSVRIWSHTRTMRGIVATHSEPQLRLEDPPPSFNPLADRYFETHGYQAATLFNISQILADSGGDADTFVESLASRGTALTEAEWIWEVLNS